MKKGAGKMLFRLETGMRPGVDDVRGRKAVRQMRDAIGLDVAEVSMVKVYTVDGLQKSQVERLLSEAVWHDPVQQVGAIGLLPFSDGKTECPDWFVEVGFRPGVTDNEARTAKEAAALVLDVTKDSFFVYTSLQYRIYCKADLVISRDQINSLGRDLLCNTLIQRFRVKSREEWLAEPGFSPEIAKVTGAANDQVDIVHLAGMEDAELEQESRKNTWALNLAELHRIRDFFGRDEELGRRKKIGLTGDPTDAEMEILAQTWSEHCKHKIFASKIDYKDLSQGTVEQCNNLYKTCIRDATAILRKQMGDNDYCKSVFNDNAGVISFINGYDVCIKVETHNSPSALDPYGGALTGIVGVNRDPMGTGLGAELVCNTDVFCFASPFYDKTLPPRLLHPARVMEGVREGVEHGGNKSGIPTVNGSLVFDERYLGKPLVYCGTVGLLPTEVNGQPGWKKKACPGDKIVMLGGRIGKDGIHGATFSSEELHDGSPATAVQIGDPITQRKMYDFIIRARDAGMYNAITDNGAGGLSSSVGEMAEDTGGCILHLENAPLKYDGLRPWEILLSEAQERMTVAVSQKKLACFLDLARLMDVEATVLGEFTESGLFEAFYKEKVVASLPMDFMHNGVPQLELEAEWQEPEADVVQVEFAASTPAEEGQLLTRMLGRLNICSKESIIRQYDHEVRGGSVIKPLVGAMQDGPADAAVLRPVLEADAGIVVSHGICPKFSDYDTYWMMANAMDEAIRNAVCVGGNPDAFAGVDNFCWCDPVVSKSNPDGKYKLAQLVRACKALRHFSLAYGVPCISGKDSMKNDYTGDGKRISIPPTVLFSIIGVVNNVTIAQSSDLKREGDILYLLGGSWKETAGSEIASELGQKGYAVPHVDAASALARYRTIHGLMGLRVLSACHDCSDGGLAVALAEMCIGGRLGAEIDLEAIPTHQDMTRTELLYGESASRILVSVNADNAVLLDTLDQRQVCRRIGRVTGDNLLTIKSGDSLVLQEKVETLTSAFKRTLMR